MNYYRKMAEKIDRMTCLWDVRVSVRSFGVDLPVEYVLLLSLWQLSPKDAWFYQELHVKENRETSICDTNVGAS